MKKKKTEKRYPEYSDSINNTMDSILAFIAKNSGGKVAEKDYLMLDKLADMLFLYEQCMNYIKTNGITQVNAKGVTEKSQFIKSATELLVQITKICNLFGLSMKDEMKLFQSEPTDNFTELMETLNEN